MEAFQVHGSRLNCASPPKKTCPPRIHECDHIWEKGLCCYKSSEDLETGSLNLGWILNLMTDVLIRREEGIEIHRGEGDV